ncbi:MAG: hypothetical protein RL757_785 [Bacteroidota bacterium]|jgi:hypothetical protein
MKLVESSNFCSLKLHVSSKFLLLAVIFLGCGKANEIPAYLDIQPFTLQVNSSEGTGRHRIVDAWVFAGDENLGIFELPATIPVLGTGSKKISIFPGIRQNGIKSSTFIYPMFTKDTTTLNLVPNQTFLLRPRTKYDRTAQFLYIEDFENPAHSMRFNEDLSGKTGFVSVLGGVEGRSGKLTLRRSDTTVAARKASSFRITLPAQYESFFLEFDHRSDVDFGVGILAYEDPTDKYVPFVKSIMFPRTDWTRTYINLTNEARTLKTRDFRVYFSTVLSDSLQTGDVWIDNLKILVK